MTIDEAIALLRNPLLFSTHPLDQYKRTALRLGIEALKLLKEIRSVPGTGYSSMLPGETVD